MSQLHEKIVSLKSKMMSYFLIVQNQIELANEATLDYNLEKAKEATLKESRINQLELEVDKECENLLTLYNPVASDLRTILAFYEINHELERIGDIADSVADYILEIEKPIDKKLLKVCEVDRMFKVLLNMKEYVIQAFENDNSQIALDVLKEDKKLNIINIAASKNIISFLKENKFQFLEESFYILSIIRKLERAGDHMKNIAEEIVFYIDSKKLKHKRKRKITS